VTSSPAGPATVGPVTGPGPLGDELAFALALADVADSITLPFYDERSFHLDWKSNRTEVTEADRGAESAIMERIAASRPDHALFGEEHGAGGRESSPWRWVVDPIDGTSNFVRGIPVWATLIALTHVDHGPVVGVVSAPAMATRWWGATGLGAFVAERARAARPLRVSSVTDLAEAQVCVTFSSGWDQLGQTAHLVDLQHRARRARGFGDFWQHMLVAAGAVDLAVDAVGVAPYDLAAPMVIVEEAGGTFTDRHGTRTYMNDTAISSNGLLHAEIVGIGR
jgi:histidinol-phosphatase